MCHLWMNVSNWMNVPFMEECAIYGGMCQLCMRVHTIYGGMCHLWMNVPFMDECNICE